MFKKTPLATLALTTPSTVAALGGASLSLTAEAASDENSTLRAQERQRHEIYKAWFPDFDTAHKAAISLHGQLLETEYTRGWQIFELDGEGIALLQRYGYRIEPASDFMARRDAFLAAIDAANAQRRAADPKAAEVGIESIPGFTCYETVEETFAAAQTMASTRPDLATWTDVGDSWQKTVNQGGYNMGALKLTNSAIAGPWSGATGSNVDVYLNSALLVTTPNDGAYVDQRSRGTWTYKVCQGGSTTTCSAEQSITF